jgi:hypothetical protein
MKWGDWGKRGGISERKTGDKGLSRERSVTVGQASYLIWREKYII